MGGEHSKAQCDDVGEGEHSSMEDQVMEGEHSIVQCYDVEDQVNREWQYAYCSKHKGIIARFAPCNQAYSCTVCADKLSFCGACGARINEIIPFPEGRLLTNDKKLVVRCKFCRIGPIERSTCRNHAFACIICSLSERCTICSPWPQSGVKCKFCQKNLVSAEFLPCGDVISCLECVLHLSPKNCGSCRQTIEDVIPYYHGHIMDEVDAPQRFYCIHCNVKHKSWHLPCGYSTSCISCFKLIDKEFCAICNARAKQGLGS